VAEKSYFFNDVNDDRVYLAEDFAMFFSSLIANGIFPNPSTNLQVLVNEETPMAITIPPGKAWINGYLYWNPDNLVKTLEPAYTNPRIDRIVVRWVSNIRDIKIHVVTGTTATVPVAPELTRNSDVWELAVADIFIGGGVATITQANITDTRLSDNLCGIVHALVQQVQTETIFNQYLGWFEEMKASNQTDFDELFSTIQGVLSGDVAGNLLNLINDNAADIAVHTTAIATNTIDIMNNVDNISSLANRLDKKEIINNVTLSVVGWSISAPYTQTISVVGITDGKVPDKIIPQYSETLETAIAQKEAYNMITYYDTEAGTIIFTCLEDKPAVDIPLRIVGV
jgi:hypothetical protein